MSNVSIWYESINKPWFAPPAYLFGIAWSILYPIIFVSFGYVCFLVYKGKISRKVLVPLFINLFSNLFFSYIQFTLQNNLLATIDILIVLFSLVWFMILIKGYSKLVFYAQIPYFLWVLFATILQISILQVSILWMNI